MIGRLSGQGLGAMGGAMLLGSESFIALARQQRAWRGGKLRSFGVQWVDARVGSSAVSLKIAA